MNIVAFDFETDLIADRKQLVRGGSPVNLSPFEVPDAVLGSVDSGDGGEVLTPKDMCHRLRLALSDAETHVVGHNVTFDYQVACKVEPTLRPLFLRAAEEGRLHDTMLLDILWGLATGRYDRPSYSAATNTWSVADPRNRGLDDVALDVCGMTLVKDNSIRLCFGQFKGRPLTDLPPQFIAYSRQDAVATRRVYVDLCARIQAAGHHSMLSEAIQVRTALVVADMDQRGIHVDRQLADRLYNLYKQDLLPLQMEMADAGLGRWEAEPNTTTKADVLVETIGGFHPTEHKTMIVLNGTPTLEWYKKLKTGYRRHQARPKFSITIDAVQAELAKLTPYELPPHRADGGLSLEYDFWCRHVPTQNRPLQTWLQAEKLKKVLTTYLQVYANCDQVYPRWNTLGARSGRMSASAPSIQNIPKRRWGIRAVFLPRPGHAFIRADYSAQELYTLAEGMAALGIRGPLLETLSSGNDPHRHAAALVLGKPPEEVSKDERQGQKVLSFGVPGGLGARSLAEYAYSTYGVVWTPDEAAIRRNRFLDAFPDIRQFLDLMRVNADEALRRVSGKGRAWWRQRVEMGADDWNVIKALTRSKDPEVRRVGEEAERQSTVILPSGRVRANCRFTEAANCWFQGIASDVTKTAAWRLFRRGAQIVMLVHDEIVVETDSADIDLCKQQLEGEMLAAFRDICPVAGPYAKVEVDGPLERWGAPTDKNGKEIAIGT